jgi:predicted anti-sigma-YlaC factor YlaD
VTEHETIRKLLPLAIAGALDDGDLERVTRHAGECESCRSEIQIWGLFSQGLRSQPQPVASPDLLARTQARVLGERAAAEERRRDALMLGALATLSLLSSILSWLVVSRLTAGEMEALGINWVNPVPWFFTSAAVTWMTTATAAIALGRRFTRRTL